MVKEKRGKEMRFGRVNKRLILNDPSSLFHYYKIKKIAPYSMLSYTALYNAYNHVRLLEKKGTPGAIVEMGCWNGGCGALMTQALRNNPHSRHIWLFDSFEGLPELTQEDEEWAKRLDVETKKEKGGPQKAIGLYVASEDNVRKAFKSLKVDTENVHIEKGWFEECIPRVKSDIGPIALLRLDGDTYDSTKYCLNELWNQVTDGGTIIIDDYNLEGCRHALYEFFVEMKVYPTIHFEPYGGRIFLTKR